MRERLDRGRKVSPPSVHEVLRSPGRPLDAATRAYMEPRFGHDFRQVRIHTDARAAESARAVKAAAYTVGRHVVLGAGRYAPGTRAGRQLLAHELAHTVQQEGGAPAARPAVGAASTPAEREAARWGEQVARGGRAAPIREAAPPLLQRQEVGEESALRLPWPGSRRQPSFRLRLDPEIEAQMAAIAVAQQLLRPDRIRRSLLELDPSTVLAPEPPPWLPGPPLPSTPPLVPPGRGPETPRAATAGDLVNAVMRVPAVDSALTRLRTEAVDHLRRDWERLSTGEQVLVLSHTALLGAGAVAGILSSPEASRTVLDLVQNRTLPVPGVPGLTFQFNLTGADRRVQFSLNVGALLPESLGFR